MCLTAHPDDEAGAFGGALLRAAAAGVATSVLCLTEGAAGSYREPGQTDAQLAHIRREEFARACEALGVRDHRLLRYADGALWQEPFLPLVGVLVEALRSFRPHVVLTFGGEGGVNLHRDHTMVSLAGTAAFHWAGRSIFFPEQLGKLSVWAPQKLYYAATPFLSVSDKEAQRSGTLAPSSLCFELSAEQRERKFAAFAQHASQAGVLERVRAEQERLFQQEDYLLVAARQTSERDAELWGGIAGDELH